MERWRCAAGVQTWKHGGIELWRRVAGVVPWRCRGTSKRAAHARRTEVVGVES